jgi:flagellar hook assembly protein FlgD
MTVYNIRGQIVVEKRMENLNAGIHTISWKAEDNYQQPLSSGIYLMKISAGNEIGTGKLLLLK